MKLVHFGKVAPLQGTV